MSDWKDRPILSPGTFRDEDDAQAWIRWFLHGGESDEACSGGKWMLLLKPPDGTLVVSEAIGCAVFEYEGSEPGHEMLRNTACLLLDEADKMDGEVAPAASKRFVEENFPDPEDTTP